jgi:hypothetical protein
MVVQEEKEEEIKEWIHVGGYRVIAVMQRYASILGQLCWLLPS